MVSKVEHKHRTGCPVACSLDILGDHWTLLIIRNLMFLDLHEYKDMLHTEERISSSILTDRLRKLEQAGLVASVPHPESGRRKLYYLTAMGKDLIYMMTDMVVWANRHLQESVRIPPEKKAMIEKDPDKFIRLILQGLEQWERTYVQ